jgi:hypothetical protein
MSALFKTAKFAFSGAAAARTTSKLRLLVILMTQNMKLRLSVKGNMDLGLEESLGVFI